MPGTGTANYEMDTSSGKLSACLRVRQIVESWRGRAETGIGSRWAVGDHEKLRAKRRSHAGRSHRRCKFDLGLPVEQVRKNYEILSASLVPIPPNAEPGFLHLRQRVAIGERIDRWRVSWLGKWDKGKVFYMVRWNGVAIRGLL
jgi:hypothetical protein